MMSAKKFTDKQHLFIPVCIYQECLNQKSRERNKIMFSAKDVVNITNKLYLSLVKCIEIR